jgi:oxalate decarboxylase/phosphoglucose isomerase-like protein (cupin superfamily)
LSPNSANLRGRMPNYNMLVKAFICCAVLAFATQLNAQTSAESYHLATTKVITPAITPNVGQAYIVDQGNFPALGDLTCFTLEIWEDSMRLPHWHPNASELGYVVAGEIEVLLWRSPGESSVFTLSAGMSWFIPVGALHSLNNIGKEHAQLLVGFSSGRPTNVDLPVAYNGIPLPLRNTYTSPHKELSTWQGVTQNPLFGKCPVDPAVKQVVTGSPYGFDLQKVTPLLTDLELGSVVWGVKDNWPILQDISILRAHLKPNVARDLIWYPDVGTLYVVSEGVGQFHIINPVQKPKSIAVSHLDYVYVPPGVLHTFMNNSSKDLVVIAFFTKANPQPEVSLSVATAFFPDLMRKAAMTEYANEKKSGDPLKELTYNTVSPYLVPIR